MLASTTSLASFSTSSLAPYNGDLGIAISPVREDSKIPKGVMSFMNESILVGLADLDIAKSATFHTGSQVLTARQYKY